MQVNECDKWENKTIKLPKNWIDWMKIRLCYNCITNHNTIYHSIKQYSRISKVLNEEEKIIKIIIESSI
jgi:hypothetical protein